MTFQPDIVDAVVFDIGGVFTYPSYQPVHDHLAASGRPVPDDLDEYRRAHHAAVLALTHARRRWADKAVENADYWVEYDIAYGATLGVGDGDMDELRPMIRTDWDWVHDDNVAAFARLVAAGVPTAIVSNNDGTAADQMHRFGVCQVGPGPLPSVTAIVDSTVVGILKPDPAIFDPALASLGTEPSRTLYVGDTVYADVDGALAAGMQVVQLDPFDHHDEFSHTRLPDVAAVVAALGVEH